MNTLEIWLLAISLAMDCFTVSITSGIIMLMQAVQQLAPIYRDPLRLLAQGYTYREIAAALALRESTVRQRIARGRKLLWKELHDER